MHFSQIKGDKNVITKGYSVPLIPASTPRGVALILSVGLCMSQNIFSDQNHISVFNFRDCYENS